MKSLPVLALVLSALLPSSLPAQDAAALHASLVTRRPDGLLVIHPPVVPAEMNNPWTPEQEERFIRQSNRFLELARSSSYALNTYFENEKRWFGYAMMQFLATGQEKPLKDLQTQDHQHAEWHRETRGIDWYAAFTIKHQVRKYFLLGPGLQPEHREAMREGARLWTEQDPLHRPHYTFQPERRDQGWGPDARNSWVDIRSTDNLLWMRDVAVYLMAEETGNRETAAKYKEKIRRFVVAIYRVGTGEWDSHNYFSHATAPVHTLFDYAKDPEVRLLAKAALDHYYAAAAVKYRNGAWNGPTKRDYNAIRPMTASPSFFALHFGNNPVLGDLDSDVIHALSSAYRPPMAVIALADKKGLPGTELFIAHASYEDPRNGRYDIQPSYHETQYFGHSFQLGTLSDGTEDPDANGFKIVADDTKTGAEMLQLVPGSDPLYPGSPQYQSGKLHGQGRVAQYGQTAIYLVRPGSAPWTWVLPNSTEIVRDGDFLFLKHANTWVAYRGLNVDLQGIDAEKTAQLREERKRVKVGAKEVANPPDWLVPGSLEVDAKNQNWGMRLSPRHPDYQAASALGKGGTYCGFIIEIGEAQIHGDYESFVRAVKAKAVLDAGGLAEGRVVYTNSLGKKLEIRAREPLGGDAVLRDGQRRPFSAPWFKYRNADERQTAPIRQGWGEGTLRVEAGGHRFECTVSPEGNVTFHNSEAPQP